MNIAVSLTNKCILFLLAIALSTRVYADDKTDSLKQRLSLTLTDIDSLNKKLLFSGDSLKGEIYTQIAMQYMKADTGSDRKMRTRYREIALSNTMKALHFFSRYNDSTGLRISFDDLAFIYHAQKKFAQAKWFILQSNTLSREKNDIPHVIASLIELASIKSDISDYSLALRDLHEAWELSIKKHMPQQASLVQLSYARLFAQLNEPVKSAIALKRHHDIDDSLLKANNKILLARLHTDELIAAAKKKEFLASNKGQPSFRPSKTTGLFAYLSFSSF